MKETVYARRALLPEGLRDQMPGYAEAEASTIHNMMAVFASYGYDRVSPPLVEFEDSLLVGPGKIKAESMFRLMDPESSKMMAVRSDITPQIARIASTRLKDTLRPLRLAYGGSVLRVKGSQIRPARQFYQAGIELIGDSGIAAQVEVIRLATSALSAIGIKDLSVDLTIAPFVPALCADMGLAPSDSDRVRLALDARDIGALDFLDDTLFQIFKTILQSAGPAEETVLALESLAIKGRAQIYVQELKDLISALLKSIPHVTLTADPGESHGFDYKSGAGFALFSPGFDGELGRGGRYETSAADGAVEQATGFTMYLDTVMQALPEPETIKKLYLDGSLSDSVADSYRAEGWRVIQGLTDDKISVTKAKEIAGAAGCTHIINEGEIIPV